MAISFVGAASAAATSLTLPTHQAGDLLLVFAYRSGATTPPTVPTGWTVVSQGGNNNNAAVLAYQLAAGAGTASGTWANATHISTSAYRSSAGVLALGANASDGGSGDVLSYPGLTLQDADGSSWLAAFGGHRQATNVEVAPTGMTNRTSTATAGESAAHDTNSTATTWTTRTVTVAPSSGGTQGWRTAVLEIREVVARTMVGAAGALVLTGLAAGLVFGRSLQANAGALAATSEDAGLKRTYVLVGEVRALTASGQDAITARSWRMSGDAAALALTGGDIVGRIGKGFPAQPGSLALSGGEAGVFREYAVTPPDGQLAFAGEATLWRTRIWPVQTGQRVLAGGEVRFVRGRIVPPWQASKAYDVGDVVGPIGGTKNGLVFKAIAAGTSAASQPLWPSTIGSTVTDGSVTWRVICRLAEDFQQVAPSSVIELFQLELTQAIHGANETYYFHSGANQGATAEITWQQQSYLAFPVEADGFEYSGTGQLPRPRIRVSNVLSTISALILSLPNGLDGAKVTRIRTLARYLDASNFAGGQNPFGSPDPTAEFPREIYYIDRKSTETQEVVEFELAAAFDLAGVRAPKRQCISNICQWQYRSAECGYTEALFFDANDRQVFSAAQDVCGKRLDSCRIRFEKIPRTGSVVKSSTTLTVNTTSGLIPGHPIFGFGIPSGTTVASITNGTQLVMSQAATVTNPVTMTGTVSSAGPTMTVSNGANVQVGMTVTGLYIPPGTTVRSISGNTITLSNRPYEYSGTGDFRYSYLSFLFSTIRTILIPTLFPNLNTGMVVFGSHSINSTITARYSADLSIRLGSYGLLSTLISPAKTTLYFIPSSPASGTYTFSAGNQIIFRTNDGILPFGSYPGVGTFFT